MYYLMLRFSISNNLVQFKSLLTLIAKHGKYIRFKISKEGISFEGTDRASYSYLFVVFKLGMFDKFEFNGQSTKEFSAWFDSQQFVKLLKLVDTIPIECEIDNNYFRLKLVEKGKEKLVSLAQLAPLRVEDMPAMNFDEFDLQLKMNVTTLREILKNVENIGGHEVYLSWNPEGLKMETKMELSQASITVMLKRSTPLTAVDGQSRMADSEVDFSRIGTGSASFRTELLENIIWAELGTITFSIKEKDMPLFIESTGNAFSLRFIVAPFISEDVGRESSWERDVTIQTTHIATDGQSTEGGTEDGKSEWKSIE